MASLVYVATTWTAAIWVGFFAVYGVELFDVDFGTLGEEAGFWDQVLDLVTGVGDIFTGIFDLVTLGGLDGPLPGTLQASLLTVTGIFWIVAIIWGARGSTA